MNFRSLTLLFGILVPVLAIGCSASSHSNVRRPTERSVAAKTDHDPDPLLRELAIKKAREDASADLERGDFIIKQYGHLLPISQYYRRVLLRDYGVKLVDMGCIGILGYSKPYMDTYNAASIAAIKQKFGDDVLAKSEAEAQRLMEIEFRDSFPKKPRKALTR